MTYIFITIEIVLAELLKRGKLTVAEGLNFYEDNNQIPQTTPEIPRSSSETIVVLGYDDHLNIGQYNQVTCDGPTFCALPEEVLNQAEVEITPKGMLYYLAEQDLDSCMLPDADTIQDAIKRTPIHLREGYWGPYYMYAYWDRVGADDDESEDED